MNLSTSTRTLVKASLHPLLIFATTIALGFYFSSVTFGQLNRFQAVIDQTQKKLVKVTGAGAGNVEAYASGMLVSDDGKIISTQGIFLDGSQVQVMLCDGQSYPATVIRRDRRLQLSLLQIEKQTPDHFKLDSSPVGQQGDWVVAVANAFKVADKDEPLSVMMGVISLRTSIDAKLNQRDVAYSGPLVLLDAITSNPGAAGGAVVDRNGDLVGMIGKIIDSSETNTRLNYAVPEVELLQFLNDESSPAEIAAVSTGGRPMDLGIKVFTLSGRSASPYVDQVASGGPAKNAGIRSDDLVVSINGQKVNSVKDYQNLLPTITDDRDAIVVVARGSKLMRFVLSSPKSPQEDLSETGKDIKENQK